MRAAPVVSLMILLGLQLWGCAESATRGDGTTPEPLSPDTPIETDDAAAQADDSVERALEAARAFGEVLGPVLVANPDVRGFEACERAGDLMTRATALRDVGVPAAIGAPDEYREQIGRLPADATLMSTNCEGDGESLPERFLISIELTFYRVLIQIVRARAATSEAAADASEAVAAARAVQEILEPVTATPMDERPAALCARAGDMVSSVGRLRGTSAPAQLASSSRYAEEVARLAAATNMAATYCGRGVETLTPELVISIEVAFDRVWLMLHGQWPGERRPAP